MRGLEGRERLSATCRVPYISACIDRTEHTLVGSDAYLLNDGFGSGNLIWSHNHQFAVCREDTIPREDIENRMFGKESSRKIIQVPNDIILAICPIGSELKRIASFGGFLDLLLAGLVRPFAVLNLRFVTSRVGVILSVRSIGDNEQLDVFKQPTVRPKRIIAVSLDLIESLTYRHTSTFEFDMYHRQTINENRHVIPCAVFAVCRCVLMNDLQAVLKDMRLVYQFDILKTGVIFFDVLQLCCTVVLQQFGFIGNRCSCVREFCTEETFPLIVGKLDMIEFLQLLAEISNQFFLGMNIEILISLRLQLLNERVLQLRFALISDALRLLMLVAQNNRRFGIFSNQFHTALRSKVNNRSR